jgi:hypothetical protein
LNAGKSKSFILALLLLSFIVMKNHMRNSGSTPRLVRHLAEAIILQSIEDLWDEGQRRDCLRFFRGDGFIVCAETAGLNVSARGRLLGLVNRLLRVSKLNLHRLENLPLPLFAKEGYKSSLW